MHLYLNRVFAASAFAILVFQLCDQSLAAQKFSLVGKCYRLSTKNADNKVEGFLDICFKTRKTAAVSSYNGIDGMGESHETRWYVSGSTIYIKGIGGNENEKCGMHVLNSGAAIDLSCGWTGRWIEKK
jgi:hypothetical protein